MKLLLDAHAAIQKKTGIGRYTDNLINNLSKKLDLNLYTHSPVPTRYGELPSYKAAFSNGVYRVFWGLNRAVSKLQPNLLHISNFAPIVKTTPIIMTVHDLCFRKFPEKFPLNTKIAFKLFFKMSLYKSDAIICVSKSVKKNLLRLYHVNSNKVHVVYEASDPVFKHIKNKNRVKKYIQSKFDIKQNYFLVVGNIETRKKPLETINAFTKILKKNKNVSLVFVGPNLIGSKLNKSYKSYFDKGKIKILGYVDDNSLNMLYNGSLSLVYFSNCEGFGLPLVESMTVGTPVICSNLEVFKEIAQGAALFVKNDKELTNTMLKIATRPKLRRKMSLMGLNRSTFFSWEKTTQQTLKIYKKVLIANS